MKRKCLLAALTVACLAGPAGCLGPFDVLGMDSYRGNKEDRGKDPQLEDDRIEDKHPSCDATPVQEVFEGCTFTLDKSCTVTKLDILEFGEEQAYLETRLFADRTAALAEISGHDVLPSMEVVNGAFKPFNDGLYAAVEIGVQDGIAGIYPGKRQFLYDLVHALNGEYTAASGDRQTHLGSAVVFVAAALIASGADDASPMNIDGALRAQAANEAAAFNGSGLLSNPISFYTWNPTLEEVFRQDRFLQNRSSVADTTVEEFGKFAAMAAVIEADPSLRQQYDNILLLYQRLTNPYASYSAADLYDYVDTVASLDNVTSIRQQFENDHSEPYVCTGTYLALFPASRTPDTDFFKQTYCTHDPPPDVNLIDVLIQAIRDEVLDLEPEENVSGWYDYQLYALETLLLPERGPESDHLLLTAAYKKKLIETFKSIITQIRETHVKQIEFHGGVGAAAEPTPVDIYPLFPVEPFPTFYLRNARAYRILHIYLTGVLGEDFLSNAHRLRETGPVPAFTLGQELREIIKLAYGLYVASARSVGLAPERYLLDEETAEFPIADCVQKASDWIGRWTTDEDIRADPRVITPVGVDQTTRTTIYWATLGVKVLKIFAGFVEGYEPEVLSIAGNCSLRDIVDHTYYLLVEEMREVRIDDRCPPMTRNDYRQLCDQYDNAEDMVAALEARTCN